MSGIMSRRRAVSLDDDLCHSRATVDEANPEHRSNRSLDMDKSVDEIIAQASGRVPAATH